MRKETMAFGLLCVLGSVPAHGDNDFDLSDARRYRAACTAGLERDAGSDEAPSAEAAAARTACLGFTTGVLAGYGYGWPAGATAALALDADGEETTYERLRLTETECFPRQLPADQVARRVLLRLRFHPKDEAVPTARLIVASDCFTR